LLLDQFYQNIENQYLWTGELIIWYLFRYVIAEGASLL